MSLQEAARLELLTIRKHADGITVGALSRTEALRQVLGGGDPRLAYNNLKHILLADASNLAVTAAAYSLGYASDGKTHLDRLNDFGIEYHYDQRQARRYSDKGMVEVARRIATEWTIEAAPTITVAVLRADDVVLELIMRTARAAFVEMSAPLVEIVEEDGRRTRLACEWHESEAAGTVSSVSNAVIPQNEPSAPAVSIRWQGEIWPRFVFVGPRGAGEDTQFEIQALGNHVQIANLGKLQRNPDSSIKRD